MLFSTRDSPISIAIHVRHHHYTLTLDQISSHSFHLSLSDALTCWSADFNAAYIESMTHKTGNFKRFSTFMEMITAAMQEKSNELQLDVLTETDLAELSGKKALDEDANDNSKRYVILTYSVAYDRVHYPLPLTLSLQKKTTSTDNETNSLRSALERAESEKEALFQEHQVAMTKIRRLAVENDRLRHQLKEMEERHTENSLIESGSHQQDQVLKVQIQDLQVLVDKLLEELEHERQLRRELEQRPIVTRRPASSSPQLIRRASPIAAAPSRFDPTAYIRAKESRLRKANSQTSSQRSTSRESRGSARSVASRESVFDRLYQVKRNNEPVRPASTSSIGSTRFTPRSLPPRPVKSTAKPKQYSRLPPTAISNSAPIPNRIEAQSRTHSRQPMNVPSRDAALRDVDERLAALRAYLRQTTASLAV